MEIIRHPGFLEIMLPEFFELDPRTDNFSRIFSAEQPGTHSLLINLTGHVRVPRYRDIQEELHFCRALEDAFRSITDDIEIIIFLVNSKTHEAIKPYAKMLRNAGFNVKVSTNRRKMVAILSY